MLFVDAFKWYQSLRFPITLVEFLSPHTLLLLEIFEEKAVKKTKYHNKTRQHHGNQFEEVDQHDSHERAQQSSPSIQQQQLRHGKHRRIAWGFYSPVSEKGNIVLRSLSPLDGSGEGSQEQDGGGDNQDHHHQQQQGDGGGYGKSDHAVRLQLYEYQLLTWMDHYQAKTQWQWSRTNAPQMPSAYLQYQKRRRAPAASTIYVDIRPIIPPISGAASSVMPNASPALSSLEESTQGEEDGSQRHEGNAREEPPSADEEDNQRLTTASSPQQPLSPSNEEGGRLQSQSDSQMSGSDPLIVCKRNPTEARLVPHRVLCRLPTGKKGCSCVAFSPCGLYLAAAINPGLGEFLIHVYYVNSSQLLQICRGHCGMIYLLEWDNSSQRLISSSSDGTARLWWISVPRTGSISGGDSSSIVWHHAPSPCFVYCGVFHPVRDDLAVTGASDGLLRFWSTQNGRNDCTLLRVSAAAVHSVRIEPKSLRIFCGDARGEITVWSSTNLTSSLSLPPAPSFELIKTIHTGQATITSMQLHPRKQHLLVHTQPNQLLKYELRSYLLLNKSYGGVICEKLIGKSTFSPDGRFVASGSEDGVPLLFASVHGRKFQRGIWGAPFFFQYPVMDIAWSPSAHIVALCSYGKSLELTANVY